jgi:hypothetical protein
VRIEPVRSGYLRRHTASTGERERDPDQANPAASLASTGRRNGEPLKSPPIRSDYPLDSETVKGAGTVEQKDGKTRRLVLGFDAGCMTCSELARRIEGQTDGKVEVRSLRDPQIEHFRKQALGQNALWAPTLIEIKGTRVRAWTGMKMGIVLSVHLGPVATWRTLQVLGELSASGTRDPVPARAGMSRGQFMKGLGGAVVTLGALSGANNDPAAARPGAPEGFKSIKRTDLHGEGLHSVAGEVAQRKDVTNIMDRTWAARLRKGKVAPVAEDGEQAMLVEEAAPSSGHGVKTSRIKVKAARHKLANGTGMLAVGYELPDDKIVIYYEFDEAVPDGAGEFTTRAALHSVDGEDLVLEGLSINGGLVALDDDEGYSAARVRCGRCWTTYRYRTLTCRRQKWGCLFAACASCIPLCARILSCAYCALVQCPHAYLYGCCRRRGYVCAPCRG